MPTTTINLTGQALSKTDDTNVTLTLGGTPLTALLKATSLTLGWTGTLAATRGGTGLGALGTANQLLRVNALGTALEYFTPSFGSGTVTGVLVASANGFTGTSDGNAATPTLTLTTSVTGLLKGNGTAISAAVAGTDYLTPTGSGAGLSGVVTTVNGASGAITNIGVTTNPLSQFAATTSAQLAGVISDETGSGALVFADTPTLVTPVIGSATGTSLTTTGALTSGVASSAAGTLVLRNSTNAFTQTIRGTNPVASITYDLPTTAPTAGQVLQSTAPSAGVVTLSWATASSGITVGTTTITSGTSTRIPFNDAGVYGEDGDITWDKTNNTLTLGGSSGNMSIAQKLGTGGAGDVIKFYTSGNFFDMNIAIGYGRTYSGASGVRNVQVGNGLYSAITGGYNTFVGDNSGLAAIGNVNYNTAVGYNAGSLAANSCLSLGYAATPTAANQCVIGAGAGASGIGVYDNVHFNGVSFTSPASVTLHACHGSGTNVAGANMTLDAGNATGTGASGNFKVTSSVKGSSGTTQQTSGDRLAVIGKYVDLTAATATAFCRINIPTSTTAGGFIIATVEANDGTDYQARTFHISWAAANKAGTTTVGLDVAHEIVAATSGTLTGTMTLVDSGSGNIDFKMDASSSLVETTLRISFQVFKNFGTGAITAS